LIDNFTNTEVAANQYAYRLESPTTGAAGVALKLPLATIDADLNARSPLPDQRYNSSLGHWNVGAGAGLEVPIKAANTAVRLGYSWQQFELYSMVERGVTSVLPAVTVLHDRHMVTGGLTVIISNMAIEAAYGYSVWGISSRSPDYLNAISEDHSLQRVILSFSLHY
jgi:hypothetical protein